MMQNFITSAFLLVLLVFATETGLSQSHSEQKDAKAFGTVPAIEFEQLNKESYTSKADYWYSILKTNKKDEQAWLNYYKALRFSEYTKTSRTIGNTMQQKLDDVLLQMKEHVSTSFAYHYASYLNGNKSDASFEYLNTAYNKNPGEKELWDDMLCKAILDEDAASKQTFARKIWDAKLYSEAEMEYNRNVLNSIEENGVLFTNGNVDTYPLLLLQEVQSFRKDVDIICLEWFGSQRYIAFVTAVLKTNPKKIRIREPYTSLKTELGNKRNRQIYLSLTIPPEHLADLKSKLFCTGLALKYSDEPLNNLPTIERNWNTLFSKKMITSKEEINKNYIIPLALLREYYKTNSQLSELKKTDDLLLEVAKNAGAQKEIKKHID